MQNFFQNVAALFKGPMPMEPDPLSVAIDQTMAADLFFNEAETPTQIDLGIAQHNHAQALLTAHVQAEKIKRGMPLNTERVKVKT